MSPEFILYTYEAPDAGGVVCHAYGTASQAECQALADKLAAEHAKDNLTTFTAMVVPLEAMPS